MSPPTTSMMGIFLQPFVVRSNSETRFLPTSKEGECVPLDTSLSFIGRKAAIMESSNGFLLCSFELVPPHINYCICNPLTREYLVLPPLDKVSIHTAVGFSCNPSKATSPCLLENADFQVVLVTGFKGLERFLIFKTFSSKTGKWIALILEGNFPTLLASPMMKVVMIGDVVYWIDYNGRSVWSFDTTKNCLERYKQPLWDDANLKTWSSTLGQFQGKLYLVRSSIGSTDLEIWILNKKSSGGSEWVLFVKKRLLTALNSHRAPGSSPLSLEHRSNGKLFSVQFIHPHDPGRILMVWRGSLFWYHLNTDKFEFLLSFKVPWNYFVYERHVDTIPHSRL